MPVIGEIMVGSAPGTTLRLAAPEVSRRHARITMGSGDAALIEDTGSSHGTFVDRQKISAPEPLHDGSRIRVGTQELLVERWRDSAKAGRTVVRDGAGLIVPRDGPATVASAAQRFGPRPRVRSGHPLKQLERDSGGKRWILQDPQRGTPLRLSDNDVQLFEVLDGEHSLGDLVGEAERRFGPAGPVRLARLLAELSERGYLADVADGRPGEQAPTGVMRTLLKPHEKAFASIGPTIDRLYRAGGWVLFLRPVLLAIAVVAAAGIPIFTALIAGRYGTPFVVGGTIGVGSLTFVAAIFVAAALREVARALTLASFGRPASPAGLRFVLRIPYPFVDTSSAWFESRRRRIGISVAGPLADLALAAVSAIGCLLLDEGTLRDVCFQCAVSAYVVALFSLNPFIERDGYHLLVAVLCEPGLRRRARDQFSRRLSGRGGQTDRPVLGRYAAVAIAWAVVANLVLLLPPLRYQDIMAAILPEAMVWGAWALLLTLWLAIFAPVAVVLGKPLLARVRGVKTAR